MVGQRSGGGRPYGVVGPQGFSDPFRYVVEQYPVGSGPTVEPAADSPSDQPLRHLGVDVPASEEPGEDLIAVPVQAAASNQPADCYGQLRHSHSPATARSGIASGVSTECDGQHRLTAAHGRRSGSGRSE
ncbi:hypothetical protein R6V09_20510 [Streptomyces sp. W16]|uniref:hypothetical protein n=1 Tax=Streptomyces sp. W16 TaxID=3076631 RepID=UPI00295B0203|nr:hypothetical protein [Streptomyces sp. W16]MDV9172476.1 hypothetical protein [Streptomyces sp. W16]